MLTFSYFFLTFFFFLSDMWDSNITNICGCIILVWNIWIIIYFIWNLKKKKVFEVFWIQPVQVTKMLPNPRQKEPENNLIRDNLKTITVETSPKQKISSFNSYLKQGPVGVCNLCKFVFLILLSIRKVRRFKFHRVWGW